MKNNISLTKNIVRRLMENRLVAASVYFILFLVIIAFLAPILANDKPVFVNYKGHIFYPAISGNEFTDVKDEATGEIVRIKFNELQFSNEPGVNLVMPPIPYAPHKSDLSDNGYSAPVSQENHFLGTGKRGEDLLAGLIHGTKISLTVGLLSMAIAGFIGIMLGGLAGFFGDREMKIKRGNKLMLVLGILPAWFYGFQMRSFVLSDAIAHSTFALAFQLLISIAIFILVMTIFYLVGNLLNFSNYFRKTTSFPVDSIISRIIEVLISLPSLILILSIAAIARPSLVNLILIIGLTSWTDIARLTRAEVLRLKNVDFIQSARGMGFKETRILFRHALPNAVAPAIVAIIFGIASAILAESALSFLGIGVPQDVVTWGSLLASGRENFSAWWLVIFPGMAIFLTVTAYNLVGDYLRDVMDPKLRQ